MEQQDLVRESWNLKYRIDDLRKEMSIKKKEKKGKPEIEQIKAAIFAAKMQMGVIYARFYRKKQAEKEAKEALKKEPKSKVIPKAKLQQPTDDVCSVCFENHKMCDVIQTCCNHQIGKECYQMWVNQCNSLPVRNGKKTLITCPVCRRVNPKVFEFRQRKTKKNTV